MFICRFLHSHFTSSLISRHFVSSRVLLPCYIFVAPAATGKSVLVYMICLHFLIFLPLYICLYRQVLSAKWFPVSAGHSRTSWAVLVVWFYWSRSGGLSSLQQEVQSAKAVRQWARCGGEADNWGEVSLYTRRAGWCYRLSEKIWKVTKTQAFVSAGVHHSWRSSCCSVGKICQMSPSFSRTSLLRSTDKKPCQTCAPCVLSCVLFICAFNVVNKVAMFHVTMSVIPRLAWAVEKQGLIISHFLWGGDDWWLHQLIVIIMQNHLKRTTYSVCILMYN